MNTKSLLNLINIHRLRRCSAVLFLWTLACPALYSAVIVTERFDYTDDSSLAGQDGGSGWGANSWTWSSMGGTFNIVDGVATTNPTSATTGVYREIDLFSEGNTVYLGYEIRVDEGTRFGALTLNLGTTEKIFTGQGTNIDYWRMIRQVPAPPAAENTTVEIERGPDAEWTLLVIKIEKDYSGDFDRFSLYVNPALDAPLGAPNIVRQGSNVGDINRIVLASGYQTASPSASTAKVSFDNLIAATEWSDLQNFYAIPEPSTALLLTGGLMTFFLFRRRVQG